MFKFWSKEIKPREDFPFNIFNMGIITEADHHPFVVIETKSNIFGNPGDLRSPVEVVPRVPLAPSSPMEETKRPLVLAMALNIR